jgi:hypothetical protein
MSCCDALILKTEDFLYCHKKNSFIWWETFHTVSDHTMRDAARAELNWKFELTLNYLRCARWGTRAPERVVLGWTRARSCAADPHPHEQPAPIAIR